MDLRKHIAVASRLQPPWLFHGSRNGSPGPLKREWILNRERRISSRSFILSLSLSLSLSRAHARTEIALAIVPFPSTQTMTPKKSSHFFPYYAWWVLDLYTAVNTRVDFFNFLSCRFFQLGKFLMLNSKRKERFDWSI